MTDEETQIFTPTGLQGHGIEISTYFFCVLKFIDIIPCDENAIELPHGRCH